MLIRAVQSRRPAKGPAALSGRGPRSLPERPHPTAPCLASKRVEPMRPPEEKKPWITASELARWADVSPMTARTWIQTYKLGRRFGGRWRVDEAITREFLAGQVPDRAGHRREDSGRAGWQHGAASLINSGGDLGPRRSAGRPGWVRP